MSTKKIVYRTIFFALMAIVTFFIIRHFLMTEEDRVRSVLRSLISGVETNNIALGTVKLEHGISVDYAHRGEYIVVSGDINRSTLIGFITQLKRDLNYVDIRVELTDTKIEINGDDATVTVRGHVTAARREDPKKRFELTESSAANGAILVFHKDRGRWLLTASQRIPK